MQHELLDILKDILRGMKDQEVDVSALKTKLARYGVNKMLASGASYMMDSQTWTLSEAISAQPHGIVLVWSAYFDGAAANQNWHFFFVPKQHVANHGGNGMNFEFSTAEFGYKAGKYLYISNTSITGNASNTAVGTASMGIKYTNTRWVLRYVYGI